MAKKEMGNLLKFKDFLKEETVFQDDHNNTRDLTFDPNKKITKSEDRLGYMKINTTYVGYWATPDNVWYGNPVPNWKGWEDKELYNTFMTKLNKKIKDSRRTIAKGFSKCRVCKENNGCKEYVLDWKRKGDIVSMIVVPEGYLHYITEHKIEPHKWFLDYIMES
jgi:hypothetical protein